jgi:hypothetical protein
MNTNSSISPVPSSFEELLMQCTDGKDIMDVDFGALDENMGVEDFDFRKVRGNVRLSQGMLLSPKEEKEIRSNFLKLQIP